MATNYQLPISVSQWVMGFRHQLSIWKYWQQSYSLILVSYDCKILFPFHFLFNQVDNCLQFIPNSDNNIIEYIWASERTEYKHLYHCAYDLNSGSSTSQPLTIGEWTVSSSSPVSVIIGHVKVQSCPLICVWNKPISFECSWLSNDQPIRIWLS